VEINPDLHVLREWTAVLALPPLPVAWRYLAILWLKGKREVVAPTSAPMLQMVAIPGGGEGV